MNAAPFTLLWLGLLSGIKHAFEADHIAAVSAITSKHKSIKKSSLLGMFWGFGHTIALLIVGIAVLLLRITIPKKFVLSLEFIVGIMLIILGINVFATINKSKIHFHKHRHGNIEHIHFHSHKTAKNHSHNHQSFVIGLIHGLAGSAAVTLLVLATINSLFFGLLYILIFGIGSILGMIMVSGIISVPFALIPNGLERISKMLKFGVGFSSIIIGLNILLSLA